MPEHDPVYKVSIIPRGRALGVTMFLPEEDRYSISKRSIFSSISTLYGGRIAEEMTLGKEGVTTGASNDIERATQYARNYVTKWGLSEKLGAQLYAGEEEQTYLGGAQSGASHISGATAKIIDEEIKSLLDNCYQRATDILEEHKDKLELMKDALMEYETIDSAQIDDIMNGQKPRPPESWSDDDNGSNGAAEADAEVKVDVAGNDKPAGGDATNEL